MRRGRILAVVSLAVLCLVWSAPTQAAPIAFSGSIDRTGAAQVVPNVPLCGPAPPNVHVTEPAGVGTSNLGAFAVAESHCTNVATGAWSDGLFTFDFGSGNTLFGTNEGMIVGTLPPSPGSVLSFTITYSLTGGTGQFTGAAGDLLATGTASFPAGAAPTSHLDISGTINTVPEPATMLLVAAGLATTGLLRRRPRK